LRGAESVFRLPYRCVRQCGRLNVAPWAKAKPPNGFQAASTHGGSL